MKITNIPPRFRSKLRFCSKPGNRERKFECWDETSGSLRSSRSQRAGRSALTIPWTTRSWPTGLPTSLPLTRVFKFHANSQNLIHLFYFLEASLVTRIQEKFLFLLLWHWQHYHRSADSLLAGQPPAFEALLKSNKRKSYCLTGSQILTGSSNWDSLKMPITLHNQGRCGWDQIRFLV